ncbi:hypothetical protein [Hymenobacter negativus]|uniref:Lipoprotein n=1 Tax=Hymenobacter negativus TaxID=2795026 RepID=A0ABS3QEE3_9BACT|nr:hypothetical protein [Hymenobacter negativus]MBO2009614.1 hypothetical protein [Hymenobacter negativus]
MLPLRLPTALLAAVLLLSTSGCIKEPINVDGIGSYKLNNVERRCVAQGDFSFPARMNQVYEQLSIDLLTTPEPATGPESVTLMFSRPRSQQGQPATSYQLLTMTYRTAGGIEATYPVNTVTIQEDQDKYAGTFVGSSPTGTTPLLDITGGTFTGLHIEP